jgi:Uma2 family endonuclease
VIEVADTSLNYDLGPKLDAYARAGVPEVWVIDVIRRRVLIRRQPEEGHYQTEIEITPDRSVTVEAFPDITFPVASFLRR